MKLYFEIHIIIRLTHTTFLNFNNCTKFTMKKFLVNIAVSLYQNDFLRNVAFTLDALKVSLIYVKIESLFFNI